MSVICTAKLKFDPAQRNIHSIHGSVNINHEPTGLVRCTNTYFKVFEFDQIVVCVCVCEMECKYNLNVRAH